MRLVKVATAQMSCTWDIDDNIAKAERLVRAAADDGANIVLIQELFATPYFCQDQIADYFDLAESFEKSALISRFRDLAKTFNVVLPVSYFERAKKAFFNSVAIVDADGAVLGNYRKSHIPDGPGYTEKYYFSPGDTGFQIFETRFGTIGVGICWDQWFPETARAMALKGAEILFYPSAIGSEPHDPDLDSAAHWRRVMQGHAGANLVPLVACNRIGTEYGKKGTEITFYGTSFIADATGEIVAEADRTSEMVISHTFDLDEIERQRRAWGLFRDRRPELYKPLIAL